VHFVGSFFVFSKINITRIIGTALGHMNLKCPQIAMKLNIKF